MDWLLVWLRFRFSLGYFTRQAVDVLVAARKRALRRGHGALTPEHLLLALARVDSGLARIALGQLGVDLARHAEALTSLAEASPLGQPGQRPVLSPQTQRVLEQARAQAWAQGQPFVGTEHLALGLLLAGPSPAADYLRQHGVTAEKLQEQLLVILGQFMWKVTYLLRKAGFLATVLMPYLVFITVWAYGLPLLTLNWPSAVWACRLLLGSMLASAIFVEIMLAYVKIRAHYERPGHIICTRIAKAYRSFIPLSLMMVAVSYVTTLIVPVSSPDALFLGLISILPISPLLSGGKSLYQTLSQVDAERTGVGSAP